MGIETNLFHILISGPFLMYVGLRQPTHKAYYYTLLALGLLLLVVFGREITKPWAVVHMALLVPLLLYVGVARNNSGEAYSFLVAVGTAAIGYHAIRVYKKVLN